MAAGFPASLSSVQPATPATIAEMLGADVPGQPTEPAKGGGFFVLAQCVLGGLLGSSCCLIQLGANLLASQQ